MHVNTCFRGTALADWAAARVAGRAAQPTAFAPEAVLHADYVDWARAAGVEPVDTLPFARIVDRVLRTGDLVSAMLPVEREGTRNYERCIGLVLHPAVRVAA